MLKKHLSFVITALLLFVPLARTAQAGQNSSKTAVTAEQIKAKVAKLGVGEKAKATVRLKDGTKIKGYIARDGEEDFVLRDRKTDAPTTLRYADVERVESNRGHSTAKHIGIGVGIGLGAFVAILVIALTHWGD
jgi:hypothetical protein